jgi:thiol-disulfide isomerase/thioredoxin
VELLSRALRLASAVALLAFCTSAAAQAAEPSVAIDQHGRSHVWRGPTGRLTLLEFAASWCVPCRKTLPRLEAFAREHPDLRALAVSVDERRQGRDELVDSLHLSLPMLWDEDHRIAEHYQPKAMPATFLISPAGEVLHIALGSRTDDWEDLVRRTEELLGRRSSWPAVVKDPMSVTLRMRSAN